MKKNVNKVILTVLAVVLVFGCGVGATLAWLQDTTDPVVNTFTEGKVDIDLYETPVNGGTNKANTYKMVPGDALSKDPTVEVLAVSEACWLFVKIEKTANVDTFLSYAIADGWNRLQDANGNNVDGVYYREVADTNDLQKFAVLKDNKVTVKKDVEMSHMNALNGNYPKLTFTAYAIQSANITDTSGNGTAVDEAWAAMNNT